MKFAAAIIICVLFYVNQEIHALEKLDFTKELTTEFNYKPTIIKVKDKLFAAGIKNNTVYVTPVDTDVVGTCEFPLNITNLIADETVDATTLGNGKIVIQGVLLSNNLTIARSMRLLIIVIEPESCTIFTTNEPIFGLVNVKSLVPYHDTFDVFFASSLPSLDIDTKTKRYNDRAEPIEMSYSYSPERIGTYCSINTIVKYDQTEGYTNFCTHSNQTSTLQLLNTKFEVVKQLDANHTVDTFSVDYRNIGICYSKPNGAGVYYEEGVGPWERQRVTCEFRDVELKPTVKVDMYHVDEGKYYMYSAIQNLPDGGAIVILTEDHLNITDLSKRLQRVYVQRITANGRAVDAAKFRESTDLYYLQGILLNSSEYCLVVTRGQDRRGNYLFPMKVEVNCIDVKN